MVEQMTQTAMDLPFQALSARWQVLAEKRLAHLLELRDSGRWRHYYKSPAALDAELQETLRAVGRWRELATGRKLGAGARIALAQLAN